MIGVPHDRWGETAKAMIVRAPDDAGAALTEQGIIDHARQHLAKFKCPTSVDWVDVLPRNPSGKILKKELARPVLGGPRAQRQLALSLASPPPDEREVSLAAAVKAWLEQVRGLVGDDATDPAVHWSATTFTARFVLDELTDTTNRIANLVGAVKSYSQMDRAALQRTDLREGLDSTMVMLAAKLKGVTVERDYDADLPAVEAHPGELNQVWTNLIDNAVDAMDGGGTLRVGVHASRGRRSSRSPTAAPACPESVMSRIFEPFFTTKDVGQGHRAGARHLPPDHRRASSRRADLRLRAGSHHGHGDDPAAPLTRRRHRPSSAIARERHPVERI